jgi:DNA primase
MMPLLPADRIAQAKAVSVVEIAAWYQVVLRKTGTCLVGLCPLHVEHRPSFTLYPATNSWYCYGCHRGGDSIDLVQALDEGMDFPQAVTRLIGTHPPQTPPAPKRILRCEPTVPPVPQAERTAALGIAVHFYQQDLWDTPAALHYLRRRGIGDNLIAALQMGYCAGRRRRDLLTALRRQAIREQVAWQSGLLLPEGRERFLGMLTIPEQRARHIVWLVGRSIVGKRFMVLPGPKYLLGLESLYAGWGVLAEGLFDWLSVRQWELPGVTPFGNENLALIQQELAHLDLLIVVTDNDGAGRATLHRILHALPANARPVLLPAAINDLSDMAQWAGGRERFVATLRRVAGRTLAQKGLVL